jgi:putative lipase involved disintegration of autophagic bodies
VLSAAELMINQHPEREYYITGHSLGGGVAKLVKLAIKIPQRARQEVGNTFLLTSLSYIFGGRTLIAPLKGEKH